MNSVPVAKMPQPVPTFSVVMGVHKIHEHLKAAIESILKQSFEDFEFLICVNGEARSDIEFLRDLTHNDSRVRIIESDIPQLAYVLNRLADEASGAWLVRMDCDDISLPTRLAAIADAVDANLGDIIGSGADLIDGKGSIIGMLQPPLTHSAIVRKMRTATPFIHPSIALRRSVLVDLRGYLGGFVTEDIDLWLRANRAGIRMANLEMRLLQYRVHTSQSSRSLAVYAEGAGHRLREFFLCPSAEAFYALTVSIGKACAGRLLLRRMFRRHVR